MNPEIEIKIREYLADETKPYRDLPTGLIQIEGIQDTKKNGFVPKLPQLKDMFENWIKQQTPTIKKKLCSLYRQRRQEYQDQDILLIAGLADGLSVTFALMPVNVLAVAVILVTTKCLDRLCEYYNSIEELSITELKEIASEAGREAYENAKRQGFPVTELREGQIVWVYPDGHTEPVTNGH